MYEVQFPTKYSLRPKRKGLELKEIVVERFYSTRRYPLHIADYDVLKQILYSDVDMDNETYRFLREQCKDFATKVGPAPVNRDMPKDEINKLVLKYFKNKKCEVGSDFVVRELAHSDPKASTMVRNALKDLRKLEILNYIGSGWKLGKANHEDFKKNI